MTDFTLFLCHNRLCFLLNIFIVQNYLPKHWRLLKSNLSQVFNIQNLKLELFPLDTYISWYFCCSLCALAYGNTANQVSGVNTQNYELKLHFQQMSFSISFQSHWFCERAIQVTQWQKANTKVAWMHSE